MVTSIPVYFVLPPCSLMLDIAGPAEVLRRANIEQARIRFEVDYYSPAAAVTTSVGLTLANIKPLPGALREGAIVVLAGDADSIMLPSEDRPPDADDIARQDALIHWLSRTITPADFLVCICSGSVLAAKAGLLDGYACTTHHASCAELARIVPRARVINDQLFVADRNRLTSAGITAGVDLMLSVVSRLIDPLCTLRIARHLVVYMRRSGSTPQVSPWLTGRNHLHPAVHKAQDAIAEHPAANWTLARLASTAAVSPRHLSRLFHIHAGMGVPDYIGQLRVALANEFLQHTSHDLEFIAEKTGFASTRQLRRIWARHFAFPPSQARKQSSS